jgi:molybdopterin synthase catalytic subunit
MKIRILAFATAREAIGSGQIELEVAEGSELTDLADLLKDQFPALEPIWARLAIAVDGKISSTSTTLSEGIEVALLPPVSGGSSNHQLLVDTPIDVSSVAESVSTEASGAIVLFVGTVRNHHRDRQVDMIIYDAYRPMAESSLATIVRELQDGNAQIRLNIVHRLGEIRVGEASVVIAVSSPHREEAYRVSREALERLKKEAPIWKQEHYADGAAVWREEESLARPDSI